jgi:hypothetical protein
MSRQVYMIYVSEVIAEWFHLQVRSITQRTAILAEGFQDSPQCLSKMHEW